MKLDNTISKRRIKRALNLKIVLTVLIAVLVLSTVFYITLENIEKKEILIWFVTTDADEMLFKNEIKLINDHISQYGIDKAVITKRHPEDEYFDVAMSTSAYYNCDVFIMNEEMVKKYLDMDMFLLLTDRGVEYEELLYIDNNAVGILIFEDYYFLINALTDIEIEIIYDIVDILISK